MLDLATEKTELAKANRDITEGEDRIAHQAELVERLRAAGQDVAAAEKLLTTLQQTLSAWKDHRDLILMAIARLEQERSRSDKHH